MVLARPLGSQNLAVSPTLLPLIAAPSGERGEWTLISEPPSSREASRKVTSWFAAVAYPVWPKGWDIGWGTQIDPRVVVRLTDDGEVTDVAVASYLAKYAISRR